MEQEQNLKIDVNTHLANERTFLAWLRTSIAIMAFGFVVEKFSIFIHQITQMLNISAGTSVATPSQHIFPGYSSFLGILLVIIGEATCFLAYLKYRETKKQLDQGRFHPSTLLDMMLTLTISLIGLSLIVYLIHSFI